MGKNKRVQKPPAPANLKKSRSGIAMAVTMATSMIGATPALAANWFQLQGVSPPHTSRVTVSGFLEPDYSAFQGGGTPAINGFVPNGNMAGPDFTSSSTFQILRARLMIRGNLNRNIAYFMGGEFGDNSFTHTGSGYTPGLIDAHVTFSHYVRGVRIEGGIIRAPGPEQAMQGYMGYNFTNFAGVTQQMMLQPFYNPDVPAGTYASGGLIPPGAQAIPGAYGEGVNAFRYPGVMAMDWFNYGRWQTAYGIMAGNFSPLTGTNAGSSLLYAARAQESYIFGGRGPFRSDVTGFAWYQNADPLFNGLNYQMRRYGTGVTYSQGYMHPWGRWIKAEYMKGSGMISTPAIFSSATGLPAQLTDALLYPGSNNTAHGYYIGAGLFVTKRLEVDLRYDVYNRLPNLPVQNRVFTTYAAGLQYHFTPLTRVMLDYYARTASIPDPNAIAPSARPLAESVTSSLDNEVMMEAVLSF
ncbi:MAG: porin [Acidiferrobacteraceae bacterium]